jgi:alkylation response protein AidB-like acyl-CoA dehydrogenase
VTSYSVDDPFGLAADHSDEERLIAATVRDWVRRRFLPIVIDAWRAGALPAELGGELGELGLLGMHLQGYGCAGTNAGSDPSAMRTAARRDGDGWVLNGTKMWITNGSRAGVAVVWAKTDQGIRGFLVPAGTDGFRAIDVKDKLSLVASTTSELVLEDCRLGEDSLLPEVSSLRGPLACLNEARYGIVWGAVGAARACLEAAIEYTAIGSPSAPRSRRARSSSRNSSRCTSPSTTACCSRPGSVASRTRAGSLPSTSPTASSTTCGWRPTLPDAPARCSARTGSRSSTR